MSKLSRKLDLGEMAAIQQRLTELFLRMLLRSGKVSTSPIVIKPKTNVYEDKDKIVFTVELPGVERRDIEVSVYGDLLTVRAERKLMSQQEKANFRWSECVKGSFVSSFYLPADTEPGAIAVEYENGLLRIRVPKKSFGQNNRIPIRADSPSMAAA